MDSGSRTVCTVLQYFNVAPTQLPGNVNTTNLRNVRFDYMMSHDADGDQWACGFERCAPLPFAEIMLGTESIRWHLLLIEVAIAVEVLRSQKEIHHN